MSLNRKNCEPLVSVEHARDLLDRALESLPSAGRIEAPRGEMRNLSWHQVSLTRDACAVPPVAGRRTEQQHNLNSRAKLDELSRPPHTANPVGSGRAAFAHSCHRKGHHIPTHRVPRGHPVPGARLAAVAGCPVVVVQFQQSLSGSGSAFVDGLSESTSIRASMPPWSSSTYGTIPCGRPWWSTIRSSRALRSATCGSRIRASFAATTFGSAFLPFGMTETLTYRCDTGRKTRQKMPCANNARRLSIRCTHVTRSPGKRGSAGPLRPPPATWCFTGKTGRVKDRSRMVTVSVSVSVSVDLSSSTILELLRLSTHHE